MNTAPYYIITATRASDNVEVAYLSETRSNYKYVRFTEDLTECKHF